MTTNLRDMTDAELQAAVDGIYAQLDEHHKTYNPATDACSGRVDHTIPYWARYQEIEAPKHAIYAEQRRRQSNATRLANEAKRAARAVTAGTYTVGQSVEVHAFGHWYKGTVVSLGRTGKVEVQYTSGTGTTRNKKVDSTKIRSVA